MQGRESNTEISFNSPLKAHPNTAPAYIDAIGTLIKKIRSLTLLERKLEDRFPQASALIHDFSEKHDAYQAMLEQVHKKIVWLAILSHLYKTNVQLLQKYLCGELSQLPNEAMPQAISVLVAKCSGGASASHHDELNRTYWDLVIRHETAIRTNARLTNALRGREKLPLVMGSLVYRDECLRQIRSEISAGYKEYFACYQAIFKQVAKSIRDDMSQGSRDDDDHEASATASVAAKGKSTEEKATDDQLAKQTKEAPTIEQILQELAAHDEAVKPTKKKKKSKVKKRTIASVGDETAAPSVSMITSQSILMSLNDRFALIHTTLIPMLLALANIHQGIYQDGQWVSKVHEQFAQVEKWAEETDMTLEGAYDSQEKQWRALLKVLSLLVNGVFPSNKAPFRPTLTIRYQKLAQDICQSLLATLRSLNSPLSLATQIHEITGIFLRNESIDPAIQTAFFEALLPSTADVASFPRQEPYTTGGVHFDRAGVPIALKRAVLSLRKQLDQHYHLQPESYTAQMTRVLFGSNAVAFAILSDASIPFTARRNLAACIPPGATLEDFTAYLQDPSLSGLNQQMRYWFAAYRLLRKHWPAEMVPEAALIECVESHLCPPKESEGSVTGAAVFARYAMDTEEGVTQVPQHC